MNVKPLAISAGVVLSGLVYSACYKAPVETKSSTVTVESTIFCKNDEAVNNTVDLLDDGDMDSYYWSCLLYTSDAADE